MKILKENIIGEIVAKDFRTAAVFEKFGLDFCCNGNRSIEEASGEAGISPDAVVAALEQVNESGMPATDYDSWPLDLMADYIEKKHHRYVAEQTPILQAYLEKICRVHGNRHPELWEIKSLFDACAGELAAHMKKEELLLFPFIRKMMAASSSKDLSAPFGTVQNPIRMMMHEHDTEGERFRKIAALSGQYTPPADGCTTYKVTFAALKEFEQDLHVHIHLENNILFPKAIALEETFAKAGETPHV